MYRSVRTKMLHNLKVRKPEFFVKINQELKISYLWNLKFHLQDFSMTNYLLYSSGEPANFITSQGKLFLLAV